VVVIDLRRGEPQAEAAATGREAREVRQPNADGKDFGALLRGAGSHAPADKAPVEAVLRGLPERVLPEIVRQTGIILREGNSGEIRLVLRPEHLGSVRVRLTLGESSLEGRIVVENHSVKEILEAGLDELKQALRQEGFQTASLDVSVADRRSGQDAAFGPPEAGPVRRVSEQFDRAVPVVLDLGSGLVNVYA
jgi:flagellar hook-length control protein FliK